MKQIITSLIDNDLYSFSVQYYVMKTYPRAEVRYTFFDRNHRQYPKGFGELLQEQVDRMPSVVVTDEEIVFMKKKLYYLPEWYFTFLNGYRFNPSEVSISQDSDGHLNIMIEGKWFSTIMWEMVLLATISELMNIISGNINKVDLEAEEQKAYEKGLKAIQNGLVLSDFGTRRRFSKEVHEAVIKGLCRAQKDAKKEWTGKFVGTSNVLLAMKYDLTPIGTMSHQIVSFEECVSGVFECNHQVMEKWRNTFTGDLGSMLYDAFGDKVFFSNFSKDMAKLFDGLRVDSGDEREQTEKIIARYQELGVNPASKSVIYSNALTIDKAIDIHQYVAGRVQDAYGIGTHLTCDCTDIHTGEKLPYSNIVVKLTAMRITERREWHDCIKLSCDKGKTLGNPQKCQYLLSIIN